MLSLAFLLTTAGAGRADVIVLDALHDNTLYSETAGLSNGAGQYFFAGLTNRDDFRRALISFNVAGNIPPGSTVHSVSLQLHMSRTTDSGNRTTTLQRMLADWGEGTSDAVGEEGSGALATEGDATWEDRFYPDIQWTLPGGDFSSTTSGSASVDDNGFYVWNDVAMAIDAQFWLDSPVSNFGWIVRGEELVTASAKRFDSRSAIAPSRRPQLTIDYTPSGVVVGSCCPLDGLCILLTPDDCTAQGGTYLGDGTTCTTNPCDGVPITIIIEPKIDNTLYEDPSGSISNGAGEYIFSAMNADLEKRRALLSFDIAAAIPEGALVTDATLTLRKTPGGGIAHDATLHRVLEAWGEGTSDAPGDELDGTAATAGDATWLHRFYPTEFWSTPGGDYDAVASATAFIAAFEAFYSWSGSGMVADLQSWADDAGTNHGWILLGKETGTTITEKRWTSREGDNLSYRPKLEITYSVPPDPPHVGLVDVPVPLENPITEEKRILGKLLFWEEQLSSDNTIACGTCHKPGEGGADHRLGVNPGADLIFDTDDDVFGSPGVRRADSTGAYIPDPVYGEDVQVTGRVSPSFIGGIWGLEQFWDGRANGTFRDPITDEIVIPTGASLESQALGPILSDVEMAKENRRWPEVLTRLETITPLLIAWNIPSDMQDALAVNPDYPSLFEAAFGDNEITPVRIAFAIATYERTLVADQTPWDLYVHGDTGALTPNQVMGADFVQNGACAACHGGPVFASHTYRNIGLRPPSEDVGRQAVTEDPNDLGRFKVPSLRNVALRNRLMHTGHITDVADALDFYTLNGHIHFTENQDPNVQGGIDMLPEEKLAVQDFLINGLTDPRVAGELFPFDRPGLGSENSSGVEPGTDPYGPMAVVRPQFLNATAFPNPFDTEVSIAFSLSQEAVADVSIYSASGQLVVRRSVRAEAGEGSFTWNGQTAHGDQAAPGVYFVKFVVGAESATGRLVRIR